MNDNQNLMRVVTSFRAKFSLRRSLHNCGVNALSRKHLWSLWLGV